MNQNGTNALCSLISVRLTGPMNLSIIFMDLEISMRVKTAISHKRVILQIFTCLRCHQVVQCEIVVISLNMTGLGAIRLISQFPIPNCHFDYVVAALESPCNCAAIFQINFSGSQRMSRRNCATFCLFLLFFSVYFLHTWLIVLD